MQEVDQSPDDTPPTVADVFRHHGRAYRLAHALPLQHLRAMWAIEHCRTPTLGGHLEACDRCNYQRFAYHSCRNRHCPQCPRLATEHWLDQRRHELLPIPYFHLVFTLPQELRPLALRNQQVVYDLLFRSAADALLTLGQDRLGVQLGAILVLHTWSQTLIDHPHVHAIVTGGGLSPEQDRWIGTRADYLLPLQPLAKLFRGKFLAGLREAYDEDRLRCPGAIAALAARPAWHRLVAALYKRRWVVFAKPAFGQPEHVLDYLTRYTRRVALSNERLVALRDGHVTFTWKDRARGNRRKRMTVTADEFIRRFLMHVLPKGFTKIRHYGLLAPRDRQARLARCRQVLHVPAPPPPPPTAWYLQVWRRTGPIPAAVEAAARA